MRLIRVKTLQLKYFMGRPPPYAILSHTWETDEFVFEDFQKDFPAQVATPKRGLRKVLAACRRALDDGHEYIWVDTCCIDKSSSAELSEAINSMFQWYADAKICYVYLEDVQVADDGTYVNFEGSRWFTRGWTLQELLAPRDALFFDTRWNFMSDRRELASRIARITSIKAHLLEKKKAFSVGQNSISTIMSWAAGRLTTRTEDAAYCLMGLFKINMPLLYGEGNDAFRRLQEHILAKYPMDQTILAWTPAGFENGALAREVAEFGFGDKHIQGLRVIGPQSFYSDGMKLTPRGVEVDVLLVPFKEDGQKGALLKETVAILSCFLDEQPLCRVGIVIQRPPGTSSPDNIFMRSSSHSLAIISPPGECRLVQPRYLAKSFKALRELSSTPPITSGSTHPVKLLDMEKQLTSRILLLNNRAAWSILLRRLAVNPDDVIHASRPLTVNIEGHPSFKPKAFYPEPEVNNFANQALTRISLDRKHGHSFTLNLCTTAGAQYSSLLCVHGIAYFERVAGPSFFVVWGKRDFKTTDSATLASDYWSCAVVDYQRLMGTELQAAHGLPPVVPAQDSQTLETALCAYMKAPDAINDFHVAKSHNVQLQAWAEFRVTKFLGMEDVGLYVGELDVSQEGKPSSDP